MANSMNSFALLVGSYFVNLHSGFFGISLPVVQVGGGLIVVATGWTLLEQRTMKNTTCRTAATGHFPPCVLSFDNALDRGTRIHFRGGYARSERTHGHALHPLTIVAALVGLG
jgi:multiple antibiotic resistance protein